MGAAPRPLRAIAHLSWRRWAGAPLLQCPEGPLLPGGSWGPGVWHWEPQLVTHAPCAWTAATGHTLGRAWLPQLLRQRGWAHAGLQARGAVVPPLEWLRDGHRVAVGWPRAVLGACMPGRGDVGLVSTGARAAEPAGAQQREKGWRAVPACGVAQASPQPEKQHLRSPGQSRSSAQRLGQAAALRWARFRGQRPGLAGGEGRLGVQPARPHSTCGSPTEGWGVRTHGAAPWHRCPGAGTPRPPYLARRASSGRSSRGCSTSPWGCTPCRCDSSARSSPCWHCRCGGSSPGSLQREMLCAATCSGRGLTPGAPDMVTSPHPHPTHHPVPTLASLGGYLWWGGGRS